MPASAAVTCKVTSTLPNLDFKEQALLEQASSIDCEERSTNEHESTVDCEDGSTEGPVNAVSLEDLFKSEIGKKTKDFPESLLAELRSKHFVFVDGIMNELAMIVSNYFDDNMHQLKKLGIPHTHLRYSSRQSIPRNAELLRDDVLRIFAKEKAPIILVGHSMGAAESLYAVLKHPELLLDDVVDKVVLIQAALGGSPLVADLKDNWLGYVTKRMLRDGLESLSEDMDKRNFIEVYRDFQATLDATGNQGRFDQLSRRVFYVRSAHHPNGQKLSFGLDIVLLFCKGGSMEERENDGLMPVENQILGVLPSFGVDLGVLEADHIELVVAGLFSGSDRKHRKAFTRALLQCILQDPEELLPLSPEPVVWPDAAAAERDPCDLLPVPGQGASHPPHATSGPCDPALSANNLAVIVTDCEDASAAGSYVIVQC